MGADAACAGQHTRKQMQQGGFAASVAPDQSEFPLVVQRERYMGKDRVIAAGIGKTEVLN